MTPGLGESVVQNYYGGDTGGGQGGTDTADQDFSGGGQDQDYSSGDAGRAARITARTRTSAARTTARTRISAAAILAAAATTSLAE